MDQAHTPQVTQPIVEQPISSPSPSDRSFLASFAMASAAGFTGLRSLYIKNKVAGIIRLSLLALALLLLVIGSFTSGGQASGVIVFGGMLLLLTLGVWAIIDMCIALFGKHVDANKQPLIEVEGERKVATRLFVGSIAAMTLPIIAIAIPLISISTYSDRAATSDAQRSEPIAINLSHADAIQAFGNIDTHTTMEQLEIALAAAQSCGSNVNCTYIIPHGGPQSRVGTLTINVSFEDGTVNRKTIDDSFLNEKQLSAQLQHSSEAAAHRTLNDPNNGGIYA